MVVLVSQVTVIKTLNTGIKHDFRILKSDNLHIGGYASIEIVDKQNDLITLEALGESVKKFMKEPRYRNVMTNHSNVQVGEVVKEYRDDSGRLWKTDVDDVGFFVVIKLRSDIEKAKEVSREIRKGSLRSFSIGGQALEKRKRNNNELGDYNEISKLELHEITICEKGINPEAKFDILKMDVNKMTNINEAIAELGTILKSIKNDDVIKDPRAAEERLRNAGEWSSENAPALESDVGGEPSDLNPVDPEERVSSETRARARQSAGSTNIEDVEDVLVEPDADIDFSPDLDLDEGDLENTDSSNGDKMSEEYLDAEGEEELELSDSEEELKSKKDIMGDPVEAGEAGEIIFEGTAKNKHDQISVVGKSIWNGDTNGLDLSAENLEKAYAEFKAEQMEKMAYQDIKSSFESRFSSEVAVKKDAVAKARYDPRVEVNELKKQFGSLLDTLKNDAEMTITKQQKAVNAVQANIPTYDEIAKMDWNEIHLTMQNLEEKSGY